MSAPSRTELGYKLGFLPEVFPSYSLILRFVAMKCIWIW